MELRPDLSRSRIQAEIMAGKVQVNGLVCDKPGTLIPRDAAIRLIAPENPYVSRGGLKLEGALSELVVDVQGMIILDVGASAGGFTDCLLNKGAKLVFALDVGYGQLHWRLRQHPRVVVMERFNVRQLTTQDLPETPDLSVIDVSFISLTLVLPVLHRMKIAKIIALIKPQFEVGRTEASKGEGVVRDPAAHRRVLTDLIGFACRTGYCCSGIAFSRWPGPQGNIEYFLYASAGEQECTCPPDLAVKIDHVVADAHHALL